MSDNTSDSNRSRDDVARAAYERFLARGQEHGSDLEDWLAAEQELALRNEQMAPAEDGSPDTRGDAAAATAAGTTQPRRRNRDRGVQPPARASL